LRIGLAFNQRPDDVVVDHDGDRRTTFEPLTDAFVEWDDAETIAAVRDALRVFGDVVPLEALDDFPLRLRDARVDFLFNMAEGLNGPNREAHVPAIAEFLGVPYLGSDPLTLALSLHKVRAKEVFLQRGVPTAPFTCVESLDDLPVLGNGQGYPVFLKPVWEGSSKGVMEANYVSDPDTARERARYLLAAYGQPVLVESFLPGEEFTVAIIGNGREARPLPLIRYRFEGLPSGALPIIGYEAKWTWDVPDRPLEILECPARIDDVLAARIRDAALAAYRALGCRDWARVDVRLDATGMPNVLEVNPLPGIIPDPVANSCFPCAARAAGMSYDELIRTAARTGWRRLTGRELLPLTQGVAS
jgi:D-alanine-D-alanine ligase